MLFFRSNHHKAWRNLLIIREALLRELLMPYIASSTTATAEGMIVFESTAEKAAAARTADNFPNLLLILIIFNVQAFRHGSQL